MEQLLFKMLYLVSWILFYMISLLSVIVCLNNKQKGTMRQRSFSFHVAFGGVKTSRWVASGQRNRFRSMSIVMRCQWNYPPNSINSQGSSIHSFSLIWRFVTTAVINKKPNYYALTLRENIEQYPSGFLARAITSHHCRCLQQLSAKFTSSTFFYAFYENFD